jgi:amino acid permease
VPIAFFSGGFVYNLFDIQNYLGNNDTAHALAFGMWEVQIPMIP